MNNPIDLGQAVDLNESCLISQTKKKQHNYQNHQDTAFFALFLKRKKSTKVESSRQTKLSELKKR